MRLLLERQGDQVTVTEDVIMAAAANHKSGEAIMRLLLERWGDQVTIAEDAIKVIAERFGELF